MPFHLRTALAMSLTLAAPTAMAATIITDGGFEKPAVPAGGLTSYSVGQKFGPWKVVGTGSVSIVSGTYTENGYTFPAAAGAQWLDLTGPGSNQPAGVSQTVTTTPGAVYTLSFKVSNLVEPPYGTSSTVNVSINGTRIIAATNASDTNTTAQNWRLFKAEFIAPTASTTLEFDNEDPSSDNLNGLDSVSLTKNPG